MAKLSNKMNTGMLNVYHRMLVKVLDHQYTALGIGLISLIATVCLLYYIPIDFVPDDDVGFFSIYSQEMEGGSSSRMLNYENQIIDIVRERTRC